MKPATLKIVVPVGFIAAAVLLPPVASMLQAQPAWPGMPPPGMATPQTSTAQRNAMSNVRARVDWLQNATRTASDYGSGGVDNVYQQFRWLRASYTAFTATLNPQQTANGGNELAELNAGLNILEEAFTNYQNDLAAGRSANTALTDLCEVLRQAAGVWLQEFNKDCARLHVGW